MIVMLKILLTWKEKNQMTMNSTYPSSAGSYEGAGDQLDRAA